MRQVFDTVWQRRGTSWLWGEVARNQVCTADEIWSLRQFLQAAAPAGTGWPEDLPSNDSKTLVVAGLEGSLDLLAPEEGAIWLGETIKSAIISFQDAYEGDAALIFWLPKGDKRIQVSSATDAVQWVCEAEYRDHDLDFSRLLWGEASEYPQHIMLPEGGKPVGLYHARIT